MPRVRSLRPREMIRALERAGFEVVRHTGSHAVLHREGMPRPIPVPVHPGHLKRGLQERIMRQAGLTAAAMIALLD